MSTLADHTFVKMNGLGNEIVVVDMRGTAGRDQRRRSARRGDGCALRPAHGALSAARAGHRCRGPHLQQRRLGVRAPAATACAASPTSCSGRPARRRRRSRRSAGLINCWQADGLITVDMGTAALCLERDPAGRGIPRHPGDRAADRADRCADPAFAVGGEHGQPARDLLGRRRRRLRSRPRRIAARAPSDLSRARQHHARQGGRRASISSSAPGNAAPASPRRAARPPARPPSPPRAPGAPAARCGSRCRAAI